VERSTRRATLSAQSLATRNITEHISTTCYLPTHLPFYTIASVQSLPHIYSNTMSQVNPHPRSANFEREFGDKWAQQFDSNYNAWFYVDKATGQSSWTHPADLQPHYAPPSGPPPSQVNHEKPAYQETNSYSSGYPNEKSSYVEPPQYNSQSSSNNYAQTSTPVGDNQRHVEAYNSQNYQQPAKKGGFLANLKTKLDQARPPAGAGGYGGGMGGLGGQRYGQPAYGGYPQQGGQYFSACLCLPVPSCLPSCSSLRLLPSARRYDGRNGRNGWNGRNGRSKTGRWNGRWWWTRTRCRCRSVRRNDAGQRKSFRP
jgi:hypothetical protein